MALPGLFKSMSGEQHIFWKYSAWLHRSCKYWHTGTVISLGIGVHVYPFGVHGHGLVCMSVLSCPPWYLGHVFIPRCWCLSHRVHNYHPLVCIGVLISLVIPLLAAPSPSNRLSGPIGSTALLLLLIIAVVQVVISQGHWHFKIKVCCVILLKWLLWHLFSVYAQNLRTV